MDTNEKRIRSEDHMRMIIRNKKTNEEYAIIHFFELGGVLLGNAQEIIYLKDVEFIENYVCIYKVLS
jgi:tmRNA-binding protein